MTIFRSSETSSFSGGLFMVNDDVVANITSEIISKNNALQEALAFSFVLK